MRKSSVIIASATVSVVAATGTALALSGAFADEPRGPSALDGPVLELSATSVHPGDDVVIEGGGCLPARGDVGTRTVEVWLVPAPGTVEWDPAFGEPVAERSPDDAGRWTVTVEVPEHRTEYKVDITCFDGASPPNGFVYQHARLVAE